MWNNSSNGSGYFQSEPQGFSFPTADPYAGASNAPPPPGPPPPPLPARPGSRSMNSSNSNFPERMPSPTGGTRAFGHHHHHQNDRRDGSPGRFKMPDIPGGGGFPMPGGGYGPPPGPPPPGSGSWAPPPGPPPTSQSTYPGAAYRNDGPSPNSMYGSGGGYPAPSGPPPSTRGDWRPPSNGYAAPTANFSPPPGPPPGSGSGFAYQPPGEVHRPPSQTQYYGPSIGTPGSQSQPSFMYSQCNGKKKALIIGINYIGTDQALSGCINDAHRMRDFIIKHFNYKKDDIVMLTDDSRRPEEQPTRANILRGMEWLVRFANPNDSLFFHYSGHGGLTKDLDGDEEDGWDEVIYPIDYKQTDHIVDDTMHDIMVKPLPAGCRLTAIFDSCHSGSALDLPYIYSTEGKVKEPNLVAAAGSSILDAGMSYLKKDYAGVFKGVKGLVSAASGSANKAEEVARRTKASPADVISWSGCKDSQTSADTQVNGQGTGAMSWAFMASLSRNPQQSYQQLLVSIRSLLREKYSQKPQLSSSHPMDTNILFIA